MIQFIKTLRTTISSRQFNPGISTSADTAGDLIGSEGKPQNGISRKTLLKRGGALMGAALIGGLPFRAEADNAAVARGFIDAWNSLDPNRAVALFTPDAVIEDVPSGGVSTGHAEIRALAIDVFSAIPDFHMEYVNSTLKGGHGTIEFIFSGAGRAFGGRDAFAVRVVSVVQLRGTKFTLERDYYDVATVLNQVGLL